MSTALDLKLIALVVVFCLWLSTALKPTGESGALSKALSELFTGVLFGVALGFVWNGDFYPGVITLGFVTLAAATSEFRILRVCATVLSLLTATYVYYFYWGSTNYLWDNLLNDFR